MNSRLEKIKALLPHSKSAVISQINTLSEDEMLKLFIYVIDHNYDHKYADIAIKIFHQAVSQGHVEIVIFFLKKAPKLGTYGGKDYFDAKIQAYWLAEGLIDSNKRECMLDLCNYSKKRNYLYVVTIHDVIKVGLIDETIKFLKKNADPNKLKTMNPGESDPDKIVRVTPLVQAISARKNQVPIILALLEAGANLDNNSVDHQSIILKLLGQAVFSNLLSGDQYDKKFVENLGFIVLREKAKFLTSVLKTRSKEDLHSVGVFFINYLRDTPTALPENLSSDLQRFAEINSIDDAGDVPDIVESLIPATKNSHSDGYYHEYVEDYELIVEAIMMTYPERYPMLRERQAMSDELFIRRFIQIIYDLNKGQFQKLHYPLSSHRLGGFLHCLELKNDNCDLKELRGTSVSESSKSSSRFSFT